MDIEAILLENELLKKELQEVREHLKKYTAPKRNTSYYAKHKEEILKKIKEDPLYKEKVKEKSKKASLKRKEQKMKLEEEKDNI